MVAVESWGDAVTLPYDPVEVGQRMRLVREAHEVRSGELADFLGVAPSAIANWESGRKRPSIQVADLMCRRFGCTLDWLFLGRTETLSHGLFLKLYGTSPAATRSDRG